MPCKPCCCISSRNGAVAIAILQIITCGMGMVKIVQAIDALSDIEDLPNTSKKKNTGIQSWTRKHPGFVDADPSTFFTVLYVLLSFWLLMMVMNIVFGSLLIYGLIKKCGPLIQAHLIFTILHVVLLFLLQLLNLNPISITVESDTEVLYYFTLYLVRFYLIYVVYCAYLETQESQMPRPYSAEMFTFPQGLGGQGGPILYPPQPCQQPLITQGATFYPPQPYQFQQTLLSQGDAYAYYPPHQQTLVGQGYPMQSYPQPQQQGRPFPIYPPQTIADTRQSYQYPVTSTLPPYPYPPPRYSQTSLGGGLIPSPSYTPISYAQPVGGQAMNYIPYAI
ncbi:unnamed protein product [Orchesella dallaii]|uniref:Uncharacterized protein n=1 Tax=Orchesella dallaii TaxID=48710 RepID=A0ABP1R3E4_9HEXA